MGLGAYLAAVTDRDHYFSEEKREREEVVDKPDAEKEECREILEKYGISRETSTMVVKDLCVDHDKWVQFMMDFELKLEKPNVNRAWISAATMGVAYFIGMSDPFPFPDTQVRKIRRLTLIFSRRLDPNDTLFRNAKRHPRSLHFHRHNSHHPPRLRLHQELGHGPNETERGVRSDSNAVYWRVGGWRELWDREGD